MDLAHQHGSKRHRDVVVSLVALVAIAGLGTAAGCQGRDLSDVESETLSLVEQRNAEVDATLGAVTRLLDRAHRLGESSQLGLGLRSELGPHEATLRELKSTLSDVPARVAQVSRAGDEEALVALKVLCEIDIGDRLAAATTAVSSAEEGFARGEASARQRDEAMQVARRRVEEVESQLGQVVGVVEHFLQKAKEPAVSGAPHAAAKVAALERSLAETYSAIAGVSRALQHCGNGPEPIESLAYVDKASAGALVASQKLQEDLAALLAVAPELRGSASTGASP